MNIDNKEFNSPKAWVDVLKEKEKEPSQSATNRLVLAKIVEISQKEFSSLKNSFSSHLDAHKYLTHKEISEFYLISSDIANYTESIVEKLDNKKGLRKLFQNIITALSTVLAFVSCGYLKFEGYKDKISTMREDIQKIIVNKFGKDSQMLQGSLGYSQDIADQLVVLNNDNIKNSIDRMHTLQAEIDALEISQDSLVDAKNQLANLKNELLKEQEAFKTYAVKIPVIRSQMLQDDLRYSRTLSDQLVKLEDYIPDAIDRMQALKAEIETLKGSQVSLIDEKEDKLKNLENELLKEQNALKAYVSEIQKSQSLLGLPFDKAAKYVHLRYAFHRETMPALNALAYASTIENIISETFREELQKYSNIVPSERPALMDQFVKDTPRKMSFLRKDKLRGIEDDKPQPLPDSQKKLSDAAKAIADLIIDPKINDKWINVLQLLVTQTSLNGAFFMSRVALTDLASPVQWVEEEHEYTLLPEFPIGGLPPIKLEIIRDPSDKTGIQEVKVTVQGSLDLVKTPQIKQGTVPDKVVIQDAVRTQLSYTVTMSEEGLPVISDLQCESTTAIPPLKLAV